MATSSSSSELPVVVIGAGIAGLYCAELLSDAGIPVVVVEGATFIGGRIKSVRFVDWGWKLCDVGADFVHGSKTVLKKYVDKLGLPCRKLFTWAQGDGKAQKWHIGGGAAMYYLGSQKKLVRFDVPDEELIAANNAVWSLWKEEINYNDPRTLEQYLLDKGVSDEGRALIEAGYSNTLCSTSDRLPLYGVVRLEQAWSGDGGGDYRLDDSMAAVINNMASKVNGGVRVGWPVVSVDYSRPGVVTLTNEKGETLQASSVVSTVPVAVLKRGDISFNPPLPRPYSDAFNTFNMFSSVKICLEFSRRFWPEELHGMVCSNSFIPEFWFEDAETKTGALMPESVVLEHPAPKKPTYLATGFACARAAELMASMSKEEIVARTLAQLDEMFGNKQYTTLLRDNRVAASKLPPPATGPETINPANCASGFLIDSMVIDWSKNHFIGGGYSSPSFGETPEKRAIWQQPVAGALHFAGEAFNSGSIMTMHSAMESGAATAKRIIASRRGKAKL